jgi:hypothetical protein
MHVGPDDFANILAFSRPDQERSFGQTTRLRDVEGIAASTANDGSVRAA